MQTNRFGLGRVVCAAMVCMSMVSATGAAPTWNGREATTYATATNPFEIEFGPGGVLYAGHHSPNNVQAALYRIPAGGGAAQTFGTVEPEDPDGIDVYDGGVYSSSEGTVWRTDIATGVTTAWAATSGYVNQSTIVIDGAGDYFSAGTAVVGNARSSDDIELFTPGGVTALVSSNSLYVVRALQFAAGTLYCTEIEATEGVWSIGPGGALTQVPDGQHGWSKPDAMVYDAATDTFVIGDGTSLYSLPRTGGTVQQVGSDFGTISGLAFDSRGWLYVADRSNHVIWQVVPEPTMIGLLALGGVALLRRRKA